MTRHRIFLADSKHLEVLCRVPCPYVYNTKALSTYNFKMIYFYDSHRILQATKLINIHKQAPNHVEHKVADN